MACPFCPDRTGKVDKKKSLSVTVPGGYYRCFKCGAHGRDTSLSPENVQDITAPAGHAVLPEGFTPLSGDRSFIFEGARAYLEGRHVPAEVWEALGIGATVRGRYAHRIIIPLMENLTLFGFVARSYVPTTRPYLYPPGMERHFFNGDALHLDTQMPVVVTEGIMDAVPLWPDSVACLGKPTHTHVTQLAATNRPVVCLLDGDAWTDNWSLALKLKMAGRPAITVRLPAGEDPGSLGRAWLTENVLKNTVGGEGFLDLQHTA